MRKLPGGPRIDIEKYLTTFFGCIGKVDESATDDEKDDVSKPEWLGFGVVLFWQVRMYM